MKVKQRTTCEVCRKGKISCDGKKPACSQCAFRGRACPGYSADWLFVPHTTRKASKAKARAAGLRQQATVGLHPTPNQVKCDLRVKPMAHPAAPPLDDLILTIIDNYVPETDAQKLISSVEPSPRICGAWVEVLPDLAGKGTDKALDAAIRAFAMSILSRGPKPSFPVSAGLEAYDRALISVNAALRSPYSDFPVVIAASVMCLLLAEVFQATSLDSWAAHLQGLGDLMQLSRPATYMSDIPHRLFVGARPVLVVMALFSRKSSFLAKEEWKTIPFRETPPSPLQALMSEAAVIPSILEQMDVEGARAAEEALRAFEAVLSRLNAWADACYSSAPESSPLFWYQPSSDGRRPHIWFENITAASALTHFWAFKAICLRNMDHLRAPVCADSSHAPDTGYLEEAKRLSVMICQSIEYLMQDRMKLFGPTSMTLPLRTAYETFEAGGHRSKEELSWCKGILRDIRSRGYTFVSFFSALGRSGVSDEWACARSES